MTSPTVLFLCIHNAGRSQMAAGWMRHLAGDTIAVHSGGSEPADRLNPIAVQAMAEVGIDITAQQPTLWTDDALHAADVVVTMGCGDTCPSIAGTRYEDWEFDDPAGLRQPHRGAVRAPPHEHDEPGSRPPDSRRDRAASSPALGNVRSRPLKPGTRTTPDAAHRGTSRASRAAVRIGRSAVTRAE